MIDIKDYNFYKNNSFDKNSPFCKSLNSNKGNLLNPLFAKNSMLYNEIKNDVTHIVYSVHNALNYKILTSLTNLNFLCIYSQINLDCIDFYLLSNLRSLFLFFKHVSDKCLRNLPAGIDTLFFDMSSIWLSTITECEFVFDNLPSTLNKIIFCFDTVPQKIYAKSRLVILKKITKFKIPFNCKIYFFSDNINRFVEEKISI
jgi:hypothetical protein